MTKTDLIRLLAIQHALPPRQVGALVDSALEKIIHALEEGEGVRLRGFGQFSLKVRPPRKGRNLVSGDPIHIPPKRVAIFKPGAEMKRRLEDHLDLGEGGWSRLIEEHTLQEKIKAEGDEEREKSRQAMIHLRDLRDNTTFLWRRIREIKAGETFFTCQIRSSTYHLIGENLDQLKSGGFFDYAINESPVPSNGEIMHLRVFNIHDRFMKLVAQTVSE